MNKPTGINESLFNEKLSDLIKVVDEIPGVVIIHKLEQISVEYISPWGLSLLGVAPEEVIHMKEKEYFEKYFNPEDARDYVPKILSLIQKGEEQEVVTFFQQVRTVEREGWSLYLSATKIFMKDEEGKPSHTITISCPLDPIHHISAKVNRLLEENNFLRQNQLIFTSLTKREKEILRLMALGQNSQEIAGDLHISEKTVETHRKNIRRKTKVQTHYDIVLFAQSFDLI